MRNLVLSVIGDDRPGLVSALADAIATNGGSWDRSQLARLAGKFAGIVVATVSADDAERLIAAVTQLDGLLDVEVHDGDGLPVAQDWTTLRIELLGNDRPGIVQEISTALSTSGATIEHMTTGTREAPMAGGLLFEAEFDVQIPPGTELATVRTELERLATELLVDLEIAEAS